jgi:hypothetical protein
MRLEPTESRLRSVTQPIVASVVAILLLFCSVLASSPSLHRSLHSDANNPGHNCVITQFTKGHVDWVAAPAIQADPDFYFGGAELLSDTFVVPATDYLFSSSRAPPAVSSLFVVVG